MRRSWWNDDAISEYGRHGPLFNGALNAALRGPDRIRANDASLVSGDDCLGPITKIKFQQEVRDV
jgi:hypothetical protein